MAQQTRASSTSDSRNLTPITGALLSALFALLGVLGLQGIPAAASTVAPTPVAAVAYQHLAPAAEIPRRRVSPPRPTPVATPTTSAPAPAASSPA